MNILVTGGTGFIGSHTAVELLEKGHDCFIIDNLVNSHPEVVDAIEEITGKKVSFHNLDCCEFNTLDTFFSQNKIDAIIHFAALKAVGESVEKPLEYYRNNIDSLLNLLFMCGYYDIENFVFSSSCTVYGEPDHLPVSESAPVKPAESPYGNTKKFQKIFCATPRRQPI